MGPKIITLDIETMPMEAWVWGLFDQTIGLDQIKEEWSIASFCWKELGKDKIHYHACSPSAPRDDTAILGKLWQVLDEADLVIGQNVKKFDIRKINARLIVEGYGPPRPYKLVDTMLEARRVAAFTSNRLAWLSKYLSSLEKDKHQDFPGFDLWKECLKGNRKAWASMKKYNPIDVIATEKVYLKLRPWMPEHPNMGLFVDSDKRVCPKCGSTDMQARGHATTQIGVYPRFQCMACGGWSRGRFMMNSKEERQRLLRGI